MNIWRSSTVFIFFFPSFFHFSIFPFFSFFHFLFLFQADEALALADLQLKEGFRFDAHLNYHTACVYYRVMECLVPALTSQVHQVRTLQCFSHLYFIMYRCDWYHKWILIRAIVTLMTISYDENGDYNGVLFSPIVSMWPVTLRCHITSELQTLFSLYMQSTFFVTLFLWSALCAYVT